MAEKKRKTWLEIMEERKLAKGAQIPPSFEQVEEAVNRRRKEIADRNERERVASEIEIQTLIDASKGKLN